MKKLVNESLYEFKKDKKEYTLNEVLTIHGFKKDLTDSFKKGKERNLYHKETLTKEEQDNYIEQLETRREAAGNLINGITKAAKIDNIDDIRRYLEPQSSKWYYGGLPGSLSTVFFEGGFFNGNLNELLDKYKNAIELYVKCHELFSHHGPKPPTYDGYNKWKK